MPFVRADQLPRMELFPGVKGSLAAGNNMMLSFLEMETGCEVPEHSHPHEQLGMLLEGEMEFIIDGISHQVRPGQMWRIPGGVKHSAIAGDKPVRALDVFYPIREDYK